MIGTLITVGGWLLAGFLWSRTVQLKQELHASDDLVVYYRTASFHQGRRSYWTPTLKRVEDATMPELRIDLTRPGAEL